MCVPNTVSTQKPTFRIQKKEEDDLASIEIYFLTGGQEGLNEIQKQKKEKNEIFSSQITRINGWIVSQAQTDRFEREGDHVW